MKPDKREFRELGFVPVTKTTDIYLSACYENGTFKGYYLSKKYTIKDQQDSSKSVKVFAPGAYRIDTLEQLKGLQHVIDNAIIQEENK